MATKAKCYVCRFCGEGIACQFGRRVASLLFMSRRSRVTPKLFSHLKQISGPSLKHPNYQIALHQSVDLKVELRFGFQLSLLDMCRFPGLALHCGWVHWKDQRSSGWTDASGSSAARLVLIKAETRRRTWGHASKRTQLFVCLASYSAFVTIWLLWVV